MELWNNIGEVPEDFRPTMVTIGNFDGVHMGHREVLARMVANAAARGMKSVAITFDPHPGKIHRPEVAPPQITETPHRLELLAETGLDGCLLVHYTWEFAQQSPEEFVVNYFVTGLHAAVVVVGQDVRFGRRNAGDITTMRELGAKYGFEVDAIEDIVDAAAGRRWSSTWIRELIAAGDVAEAATQLGRPHQISGVIVRGFRRGRELGFPTANLEPRPDGMVPADGVYEGRLIRPSLPDGHPDKILPLAISVGTNPQFGGTERVIEGHVPGRDDLDLYGETVIFRFIERLRHVMKFDEVSGLIEQMKSDVAEVARRAN